MPKSAVPGVVRITGLTRGLEVVRDRQGCPEPPVGTVGASTHHLLGHRTRLRRQACWSANARMRAMVGMVRSQDAANRDAKSTPVTGGPPEVEFMVTLPTLAPFQTPGARRPPVRPGGPRLNRPGTPEADEHAFTMGRGQPFSRRMGPSALLVPRPVGEPGWNRRPEGPGDPRRSAVPERPTTMDQYSARARRVFGGWEVTVAGVPSASFIHRDPTDEVTHEKLAVVLARTDFRVSLVRDDAGKPPR